MRSFGVEIIQDGPKIPENLLQAHEEGRVVFFCGAGISLGAGLPLFEELVKEVANHSGGFDGQEQCYFINKQFDITMNLISQRIGHHEFRRAIWKSLRPNYGLHQSQNYHKALLTLSKTKEGKTRLVTTNFDRIFEKCLRRTKKNPGPEALVAPRVPIAKDHYWDGLAYLHGLLPEKPYS